ncbi:MAG: GDSL-type esterase/lipase family protein [Oscillospiraceae bacterium]|nr:GDSL-type esterase/lipase family protein [Oscillospiraceae bacterium]
MPLKKVTKKTRNSPKLDMIFIVSAVAVIFLFIYLNSHNFFSKPGSDTDESETTCVSDSSTYAVNITDEPIFTGQVTPETHISEPVKTSTDKTECTTGAPDTVAETETGETKYMTVTDDYFKDAAFVGDSITDMFILYANIKTNAFFSRGIMVNNLFEKKFVLDGDDKIALGEAFKKAPDIRKVYIMAGTNEQGWSYPALFKDYYKKAIMEIRKCLPDAIIYVQGTLPVTREAEKRTDAIYDNNIASDYRRQTIELCGELKGQNIYYLDIPSIFIAEDGYMSDGVSFDGVHPVKKYVEIWREYLKTHAVINEASGN